MGVYGYVDIGIPDYLRDRLKEQKGLRTWKEYLTYLADLDA